jgi:hypothetical protein
VSLTQIVVALSDGNGHPVGSCWSIKTKKDDFYIEPLGSGKRDVLHLSVHGPRPGKPAHRFHIKVDEPTAARKRTAGQLIEHGIPRSGQPLRGVQVGDDAFLVCRLRWMPALQRPEYLAAASVGVALPELTPEKQGAVLGAALSPESAWDLDLVVSYRAPYWPHFERTKADDAQLGPLQNDAGMYITVTSFHRPIALATAPDGLVPATPGDDETPNILLCGGLDSRPEGDQDMYWFVETITSRELLLRSFPDRFS